MMHRRFHAPRALPAPCRAPRAPTGSRRGLHPVASRARTPTSSASTTVASARPGSIRQQDRARPDPRPAPRLGRAVLSGDGRRRPGPGRRRPCASCGPARPSLPEDPHLLWPTDPRRATSRRGPGCPDPDEIIGRHHRSRRGRRRRHGRRVTRRGPRRLRRSARSAPLVLGGQLRSRLEFPSPGRRVEQAPPRRRGLGRRRVPVTVASARTQLDGPRPARHAPRSGRYRTLARPGGAGGADRPAVLGWLRPPGASAPATPRCCT